MCVFFILFEKQNTDLAFNVMATLQNTKWGRQEKAWVPDKNVTKCHEIRARSL